MKLTNTLGLPDVVVRAVANDPYNAGPANISVTTAIAPPRIRALKQRYDDQIVEDVSKRIPSLMGQLGHLVLERAAQDGNNDIHEQRFFVEIDGWTVSGAVDLLATKYADGDRVLAWGIRDFKYTKAWKVMSDDHADWENQLNCYAYMVREYGFQVEDLKIIAILRDWEEGKAARDPDYPQAPVAVIDIPMWTHEQCREYLQERVRLHREAEALPDNELPLCSQRERWVRDQSYALIPTGGVRAKKVYDTLEEALEGFRQLKPSLQEVYEIQTRGGTSIRCVAWCPVAPFCNQWQAEKSAIEAQVASQPATEQEKA